MSAAAASILDEGYAVLDPGFSAAELADLARRFERLREDYAAAYGLERLVAANEQHVIRAPLLADPAFLQLAATPALLDLLSELIEGRFVLNQQNGVINPPRQAYDQGAWHRDLPYQNFLSDTPLGVNALFCLDDFSSANGATFVVPGSHRRKDFPEREELERVARQAEAPRGSFLVMNCMLFHAGGPNRTSAPRRAINQLYTIPYIRQQIQFSSAVDAEALAASERSLLGLDFPHFGNVSEFVEGRIARAASRRGEQ